MKNCWRALWLLLAGMVLAGCAALRRSNLSAYDPECFMNGETVQVPLGHDTTLQWRVNAEVDGIPGVFVVDTGADFTVITPQMAQRLAASKQGEEDQSISRRFHWGRVDFAKIGRFQMDGASYLGFYAPVVNLDHISRAARTEVDGIVGNNVLNKTAYEVDWKRDLLTLRSRSSNAPTNALPIAVRENRVYLDCHVNGQATRFALDTGAYRSTIARRELSRLNIPREDEVEIEAPRIDIHGSESGKQIQARLDSLQFGPILRNNYLIMTWDNNALGMDLLSDWILRVDARRGWMSLEKPATRN